MPLLPLRWHMLSMYKAVAIFSKIFTHTTRKFRSIVYYKLGRTTAGSNIHLCWVLLSFSDEAGTYQTDQNTPFSNRRKEQNHRAKEWKGKKRENNVVGPTMKSIAIEIETKAISWRKCSPIIDLFFFFVFCYGPLTHTLNFTPRSCENRTSDNRMHAIPNSMSNTFDEKNSNELKIALTYIYV